MPEPRQINQHLALKISTHLCKWCPNANTDPITENMVGTLFWAHREKVPSLLCNPLLSLFFSSSLLFPRPCSPPLPCLSSHLPLLFSFNPSFCLKSNLISYILIFSYKNVFYPHKIKNCHSWKTFTSILSIVKLLKIVFLKSQHSLNVYDLLLTNQTLIEFHILYTWLSFSLNITRERKPYQGKIFQLKLSVPPVACIIIHSIAKEKWHYNRHIWRFYKIKNIAHKKIIREKFNEEMLSNVQFFQLLQ